MYGKMSFNNAVFDDLHSKAGDVRTKYEDIWAEVHREVMNLLREGGVDETLGTHVETRERQVENCFKAYDENHGTMSNAMLRSQQVGNDGAQHMRNVMGYLQ